MEVTVKLQTPTGQVLANLDDETFVLNGDFAFVPVREATALILRYVDRTTQDITFELKGVTQAVSIAPGDTWAKVLEIIEPALTSNLTDQSAILHAAPLNGACTCLITCKGTKLSFVKVESI